MGPSDSEAEPLPPAQPARTMAEVDAAIVATATRRSARDFTCHSFVVGKFEGRFHNRRNLGRGSALTGRRRRYGIAPTNVKGALPRDGHSSVTGAERSGFLRAVD